MRSLIWQAVPYKGVLLNQLTLFWYRLFTTAIPDLKTHFLSLELPPRRQFTPTWRAILKNRYMQVRKYKVFPIEAIVRGYITGSAWKEYQQSGTVHGRSMPKGLQESQGCPDGPIYTPSTKAEAGQHDENISVKQGKCPATFHSLSSCSFPTTELTSKRSCRYRRSTIC